MTDRQISELSERELEILRLVATGASNKEIAQKLFISANTVKVHLRNIFAKVDVNSRTEAAMYAVRMGFTEGVELKDIENSVEQDKFEYESVPNQNEGSSGDEGMLSPAAEFPLSKPSNSLSKPWLIALAVIFLLVIAGLSRDRWFPTQIVGVMEESNESDPTSYPRWKDSTPLSIPRHSLALVNYGDYIIAIGGETEEGITGAVERYDPSLNEWLQMSPKPNAVADASAAVLGGLVYVPGGRKAANEITDTVEVFNPEEDSWEKRSPLPVPLSAYTLIPFEGKLYIFGGWDGQQFTNSVFEYDPTLDAWSNRSPMPTARGYAGGAVAGGRIYVLGGYNGDSPLDINEVYLPNREDSSEPAWMTDIPMPDKRYGMGVTSVADIIQIVGGIGESEDLYPLEYIPISKTWQELDWPVSGSWVNLGVVSLGQYLYAIGGELNGEPTSKSLEYQAIFTVLIPFIR